MKCVRFKAMFVRALSLYGYAVWSIMRNVKGSIYWRVVVALLVLLYTVCFDITMFSFWPDDVGLGARERVARCVAPVFAGMVSLMFGKFMSLPRSFWPALFQGLRALFQGLLGIIAMFPVLFPFVHMRHAGGLSAALLFLVVSSVAGKCMLWRWAILFVTGRATLVDECSMIIDDIRFGSLGSGH